MGEGTNIPEEPKEVEVITSLLLLLNKNKIDSNIKHCFNLKSIAECYIDLIDKACDIPNKRESLLC
jgi:hypothetical protein